MAAIPHNGHLIVSPGASPAHANSKTGRWNHGVRLEALANLAHELRSPVQAVLGYLEILRDELGEALHGSHKLIINRMAVNVHDLAQTVENVLDFAVADAMAEGAAEEDIRVHDLLAEVLPALEAANESKGLNLRFDIETAPAIFHSRRRPIKSILLNLALNAIKFTDKGSVTIAIRRASLPHPGEAIELEISDTGPGIEASKLTRAFKQCAQLSNASIRRHRGMGLGLAVVQRNVESLGARLFVRTARGMGSSFLVAIPIALRTAAGRAKPDRGRAWTIGAVLSGNGASGRPRRRESTGRPRSPLSAASPSSPAAT